MESSVSPGAREQDPDMECIWTIILYSGLGVSADLKTAFFHLLNPRENFL